MDMEREKRELEKGTVIEQEGHVDHGNTAVLNSEADLSDLDNNTSEDNHDDPDHDHDQGHNHVDYHNFSKQQIVALLKDFAKEEDFKKVDRVLRDLKPIVDESREKERTAALNRFILDGSKAEDFEYKGDAFDADIDSYFKQLKDKRTHHYRNLEDKKNENLNKKQELLERLRELIDAQDVADQFDKFKELQREWKNTGPVPGMQAKTLWANYHALVDRFYDNQSIYFELKELDRRKNLETKVELCVRAEKLLESENIKDAIRELNELHHEFKHVGPVPKDDKEGVWQRFKAASDTVYAKRDEFLKSLQQELHQNLELKNKLGDEVLSFVSFSSDRIKEWNLKTKEILELQKKWEIIGGLPRTKAKDVNKKFWSSFKTFFSNKNAFFKKLDEERSQNLKKKEELVKQALELRVSEDWDKTSNTLKNLQQHWKDIGPVPEKFREKVFKEFKEACDYFFEQKREQHGKQDLEQQENQKVKEGICLELEKHTLESTASIDLLHQLEGRFNEVGFVPRKEINNIRNRYHEAIQKFVGSIKDLSEDERTQLLMENQIMDLKNDPMGDQKIYQKEQAIRKKISKVENDIVLWKNNLEFFGRSQNADKVREEFNGKIKTASEHLHQLKQQLKMLRTVS